MKNKIKNKLKQQRICFITILQLSNQVHLNSGIIFLICENLTGYNKKLWNILKTNGNFLIFKDSKILDENI